MTDIASITLWHRRARPEPTDKDFQVQFGCHLEEIAEMLICLEGDDQVTKNKLATLAFQLAGAAEGFKMGVYSADIVNRKEFLDACCDQVVTAVGAAYCAQMNIEQGMAIVNTSNWSKFDENGQPMRDENGKIKKGPRYNPPHLGECV